MQCNDREGESAPQYPRLAGAQHNVDESCQPLPGTTRPDAKAAPTWDDVDSDITLRRGLGYLHARDDTDARGLPATSDALVDRQACDPLPPVLLKEDFGVTMILTRLLNRQSRM